jgi:hypothetical protein
MSDLELFLSHLDSRLEPINIQLAKLTDLQAVIVAVQERDRHQAEDLKRLDTSVSEAFQIIRANKDAADARHELSRERHEKLHSEHELASKKCNGVEKAFNNLETAFNTHEKEYTAKKNIGYGMWLMITGILVLTNWLVQDYYDSYKADKVFNQHYIAAQETANVERDEQLKILTQQIRGMRK